MRQYLPRLEIGDFRSKERNPIEWLEQITPGAISLVDYYPAPAIKGEMAV